MSLRGRLQKLETEEVELRRMAEELVGPEMDVESLVAGARRGLARLRQLKRTHPLPALNGEVDIEPHLRMLAVEERLDPDEVMEEARRVAERLSASWQEAAG